MSRVLFNTFVFSTLAAFACGVTAQAQAIEKGAPKAPNQVFVKIILPVAHATPGKDRPVVESWIAEQLRQRGQSEFTAATAWVPLADATDELLSPADVWDGTLDGKAWACPVSADIVERVDGRITVRVHGWAPVPGVEANLTLNDEPGSRVLTAVKPSKTPQELPYVAVLIGPAPNPPAAPIVHEE